MIYVVARVASDLPAAARYILFICVSFFALYERKKRNTKEHKYRSAEG